MIGICPLGYVESDSNALYTTLSVPCLKQFLKRSLFLVTGTQRLYEIMSLLGDLTPDF
jgi:hypothetical protein